MSEWAEKLGDKIHEKDHEIRKLEPLATLVSHDGENRNIPTHMAHLCIIENFKRSSDNTIEWMTLWLVNSRLEKSSKLETVRRPKVILDNLKL